MNDVNSVSLTLENGFYNLKKRLDIITDLLQCQRQRYTHAWTSKYKLVLEKEGVGYMYTNDFSIAGITLCIRVHERCCYIVVRSVQYLMPAKGKITFQIYDCTFSGDLENLGKNPESAPAVGASMQLLCTSMPTKSLLSLGLLIELEFSPPVEKGTHEQCSCN